MIEDTQEGEDKGENPPNNQIQENGFEEAKEQNVMEIGNDGEGEEDSNFNKLK